MASARCLVSSTAMSSFRCPLSNVPRSDVQEYPLAGEMSRDDLSPVLRTMLREDQCPVPRLKDNDVQFPMSDVQCPMSEVQKCPMSREMSRNVQCRQLVQYPRLGHQSASRPISRDVRFDTSVSESSSVQLFLSVQESRRIRNLSELNGFRGVQLNRAVQLPGSEPMSSVMPGHCKVRLTGENHDSITQRAGVVPDDPTTDSSRLSKGRDSETWDVRYSGWPPTEVRVRAKRTRKRSRSVIEGRQIKGCEPARGCDEVSKNSQTHTRSRYQSLPASMQGEYAESW